jgi:hypothetical protein
MNLLPCPRVLKRGGGFYFLPSRTALQFAANSPQVPVFLPMAERVRSTAAEIGVALEISIRSAAHSLSAIRAVQDARAPDHPEGYALAINSRGVLIQYRQPEGLRAAVATLRQLLREYGRRLPHLAIRDYPDFPRRGVMVDVSRGRVPKLETLLELVEHLADFKINEFQLYTEHTFAFRHYEPVWRDWGALTSEEIRRLDTRCRELGIDLVPNQNSFGHLRHWLEYPPLKPLAEVSEPYQDSTGDFLRYPSTLAPNHPGTLPFLRGLYDELLPCFSSKRFNVGCDETWDLGRGQSKILCEKNGKDRVYLDFLKKIHGEVSARGRQMMFWGDIILRYPELIKELPKNIIALNWGYEANHPFDLEAVQFEKAKIPFYVCPGTSSWMTLIGRHDNSLANLRNAARAGRKHGASGYLITDWGDGGHPQPLAVSYLPYLAGAALSWCAPSFDKALLIPVLNRDVFHDPTRRAAKAAFALGIAHRKFQYTEPNATPFGAVIAAPPPEARELVCRNGLKYYARIPGKNIRAALDEVEAQRAALCHSLPTRRSGEILSLELDLAARMALQSCKIMLWHQALAAGKVSFARRLAKAGIRDLRELANDFDASWPLRNKGATAKCSAFLQWRISDYRKAVLPCPPEIARQTGQCAAPGLSD